MKIMGLFFAILVAATTAGVATIGCGTTTNNTYDTGSGTSTLGQSCQRTFDCKNPLVCIANTCFAGPPSSDASAPQGGDAGAMVVATGPRLGSLNESCQVSSDCATQLECIANTCAVISYNLTATGKSCSGECTTATDCCELPPNFSTSLYYLPTTDGGYLPERVLTGFGIRCEDLLGFVGGDSTVCAATTFPPDQQAIAQACFDYNTFCKCGPSTWACNNNACAYTGACTVNAATIGGCPSMTRTGRALGTACNMAVGAASGSCQSGCTTPADCSGTVPTGGGHACSAADAGAGATDCTCYQSACYFKCTKDIDCASGSTCDTTTSLCKATGCTTAADCVETTGNPRAQCSTGKCAVACARDVECNPPSTVCSAGFCAPPGCNSDSNCTGSGHLFCVPAKAVSYTSAVTN